MTVVLILFGFFAGLCTLAFATGLIFDRRARAHARSAQQTRGEPRVRPVATTPISRIRDGR
jgi:hypothetical protein